MNGCIPHISNRCSGTEVMAPCVTYEGNIPESSKLTGGCVNLEQVVEDLYETVDSMADLKDVGERCITYKDKTVPTVIAELEKEICLLKESNNRGVEFDLCTADITNCGFDLSGLVDSCTGVQPKTFGELIRTIIEQIK